MRASEKPAIACWGRQRGAKREGQPEAREVRASGPTLSQNLCFTAGRLRVLLADLRPGIFRPMHAIRLVLGLALAALCACSSATLPAALRGARAACSVCAELRPTCEALGTAAPEPPASASASGVLPQR